jgi:rod shape determining protein RodA
VIATTARGARGASRPFRRLGSRWRDFDFRILITTVVLMCFGALTIYSAQGAGPIDLFNLGVRQAMYGLVGLVLMLVVASIDYRFIASVAWPLYGMAVLALALVLVPGIGAEVAGSRRWFDLGFTTIQPSEFGKLVTIVALASFVASRGPAMREPGNFVLSMLIAAVPAAFVFEQPDLGTSLVYGVSWLSIALISPIRRRYLAGLAVLAPVAIFFAWRFMLEPYQRQRWLVFLDPQSDPRGDGFNLIQAQISIGSGGWTGFGIEGGTQSQLGLLKVRESDFIFAHASGMFGYIGMIALLLSFAILIWRCIHVVEIAKDTLGQCIAIGVTGILLFQSVVNIGMNAGLMPVTGITLPFISSGVSSLWTFLIAEGMLQSILIHHRKLAFQPD